jgi:hypothetical protein
MYRVESAPFGIKLTLSGFIQKEEYSNYAAEVLKLIRQQKPGFCVFVDMRELKPLPADCQSLLTEIQATATAAGMARAVHVHKNPVTIMQMRRLAKLSGIHDTERFVDSSSDPNWEQAALDWLLKGTDPDSLHGSR